MGKRLAKRDVKPDLILSSPARRALTTAEIIAKKLDYKLKHIVVDDRLYAGAVHDLLNVIHKLGDKLERVMLFGHNPELTESRASPLKRDHPHTDVRRRRVYVQWEVVVKHRQGQARKSGARLSKEIVGQSIASVMKAMMRISASSDVPSASILRIPLSDPHRSVGPRALRLFEPRSSDLTV